MRRMNWLTILLLITSTAQVSSQNWCDSTLTVCDSVSLDSVFFTHTFGDRVHITMTSHYVHLYAPSFVFCPDNEALELEQNHYGYFSLFGPSTISPHYDFLNFELIGDSLSGRIILDNSNNGNSGCVIDFQVIVSQSTGEFENDPLDLYLFPNPAQDYLHFSISDHKPEVRKILMINSFGEKREIKHNADRIDLRYFPAGLYLLVLELTDGRRISEKVGIATSSQ